MKYYFKYFKYFKSAWWGSRRHDNLAFCVIKVILNLLNTNDSSWSSFSWKISWICNFLVIHLESFLTLIELTFLNIGNCALNKLNFDKFVELINFKSFVWLWFSFWWYREYRKSLIKRPGTHSRVVWNLKTLKL